MAILTCSSLVIAGALGCAPAAISGYPSYEETVAKYAPPGRYAATPLGAASGLRVPADCDCPRVWYDDHWVYYWDGHWVYWDQGIWYRYPVFYVYYHEDLLHVYDGRTRGITKGPRPSAPSADDLDDLSDSPDDEHSSARRKKARPAAFEPVIAEPTHGAERPIQRDIDPVVGHPIKK